MRRKRSLAIVIAIAGMAVYGSNVLAASVRHDHMAASARQDELADVRRVTAQFHNRVEVALEAGYELGY